MKTIIITGGAKGIGEGVVRKFAENGYNVVIDYNKSESKAKALQQELNEKGYSVSTFKADVSNEDDVKALVNFTINNYHRIDALFNNAGIDHYSLLIDDSVNDYYKVFDTNFKSVFLCSKYVGEHMIFNKYGKIINNASVWGLAGGSFESLYSASKGAIIAYTKALSKELGPSNINVNAVAPGLVDTDMCANLSKDDKINIIDSLSISRIGTPNDIANAVFFLASEDANYITGQTLVVDGGDIDV